jgi:hypothetical protein
MLTKKSIPALLRIKRKFAHNSIEILNPYVRLQNLNGNSQTEAEFVLRNQCRN